MNKDNAKEYLPLVQALAEGRVIQGLMAHNGKWEDLGEMVLNGPADQYRIKHEPREIWVNEYADGSFYAYGNEDDAIQSAAVKNCTRRYREVIE